MKLILTAVFFIAMNTFFGQNKLLDSCGIDNNLRINKYESDYLNTIFIIENFNFENKKIKFRYSNYGFFPSNKKKYFLEVKEWLKSNTSKIHEDIIILTEEEKIKYGDYDAIIISWSKIPVTEKFRIKFLKNQLKRPE